MAHHGWISVRLAMSLDGYIADRDGGYDWIEPVPSPGPDTEHARIDLRLVDCTVGDGKVRLFYRRR